MSWFLTHYQTPKGIKPKILTWFKVEREIEIKYHVLPTFPAPSYAVV